MRSFIIYVLLASIMLPTLSPWGTIVYFQINRDYIAKVLCENRKKPQLNCNGKCYLAKRLKAQQDKLDKETNECVSKLPTIQLFVIQEALFEFNRCELQEIRNNKFFNQSIFYPTPIFKILRPPQ